jgi:hypothetical protein
MSMVLFDDNDLTLNNPVCACVFQAGLEGDPAAPGEPRTPPGPLHPPSSPEMDDTNSKRQATRWVLEQILFIAYSACEPIETVNEVLIAVRDSIWLMLEDWFSISCN